MSKGGSKAVTAVISFLIGFLFAFIVEIGALFGVGYYVYSSVGVDQILSFVGLDNSKDEYVNNPNNNLTLKGLVSEVNSTLFNGNWDVAAAGGACIDQVNEIFPFVKDKLLNAVYNIFDKNIGLEFSEEDKITLETKPFADLLTEAPKIVMNNLYNIKTGTLMDNFMELNDDEASRVLRAFIMGAEAEYASVDYGATPFAEESGNSKKEQTGLPVLYDTYKLSDGEYYRTLTNAERWHANVEKSLICDSGETDSNGNKIYRLYYVPCRVTETSIDEPVVETRTVSLSGNDFEVVSFADDTDFIAVKPSADGSYKLNYSDIYASLNEDRAYEDTSDRFLGYSYYRPYVEDSFYSQKVTIDSKSVYKVKSVNGLDYYRNSEGKAIYMVPARTINDLRGSDSYAPLKSVPITSVLKSDDDFVSKVFGKTSLGALMDGSTDLKKTIDGLELSTFVNNVEPTNKLMANIVFRLSDVSQGDGGKYYAVYDKGGKNECEAEITLKNGYIDKIYEKGNSSKTLEGAKVNTISSLADEITVNVLMDVAVDDAVMMFLGYGITGVYEESGQLGEGEDAFRYDYIGTYNVKHGARNSLTEKVCYIAVKGDGKSISRAVINEDPEVLEEVPATRVNEISVRVNTIMDYLTLPDFLSVDPDDAITTYIGYKIYSVNKAETGATDTAENGRAYDYKGKYSVNGEEEVDCFITVKPDGNDLKIVKAWYIGEGGERVVLRGTKVKEVPDAISGMKDKITLGEIINIDENDPNTSQILKKLKDTTINGINDRINTLLVDDIFTEKEINDSAMLRQLRGVKVTELAKAIDTLLIQRIYSKEVYGLPEDCDPLGIAAYEEDGYYWIVEESKVDGKTVYAFVPLNEGTADEGKLTKSEFDARGIKEYYIRTQKGTDEQGEPVYEFKMVCYRIEGGEVVSFNSGWLYYEYDETAKKYNLTEINVPENATATQRDDTIGNLLASDLKDALLSGKQYYTYGEAHGMWRLVLYKRTDVDNDGVSHLLEKGYTINNFNNMVAVCANNVFEATLMELYDAKVITGVSLADLDKRLTWVDKSGNPQTRQLKDLTFKQLIDAVLTFAS